MRLRSILAVFVLFAVLAGCSEDGTGDIVGSGPSTSAIATSTATPSPMDSTSLPMLTPTHNPAEASSLTPALPVANTPTLPPTPTTEATGTLQAKSRRYKLDLDPGGLARYLARTGCGSRKTAVHPYDPDDYPYNQSVETAHSRVN